MHIVDDATVRRWFHSGDNLEQLTGALGSHRPGAAYMEQTLGLPLHVQFCVSRLSERGRSLSELETIPFYSLCRGLFIPLMRMHPEKGARLFQLQISPPPDTAGRAALVESFLDKDIGLSAVQKIGCLVGDVFVGRTSTFKRDSLVRLLMQVDMKTRRQMLDRLTQVGDVGVLFAESRRELKGETPLTAGEVLLTLEFLPDAVRSKKFELLRSLLTRMGKVEAYFLARLILRKADFGFEYEGAVIAKALATYYDVEPEAVQHAIALSDPFAVANTLATKGAEGLREVRLQPLVAIKPALASGSTDGVKKYPAWVERKYDGIRMMLHKSSDAHGSVLCAAYTRGRKDWLEQIRGMRQTITNLPCRDVIIDGELHGTVLDLDGPRPATVYEVYASLSGEVVQRPVNLKYAAFDLVYLNGQDLTQLQLRQRRQALQSFLGPATNWPLPIPLEIAEGQLANNKNDVNRLYQYFRNQGHEGIITKDLDGVYALARRDPNWLKRKPEITLDLVLLQGIFSVTTKQKAGMFGSFAIGARTADGGFVDVGDVAGVDVHRDREIQAEIMRNGLMTGKRVERQSSSGVRPGVELRPHIVVVVRFEGIVKDNVTKELKLRDPKLVAIRSDKHAGEADKVSAIEELYFQQRMG
ncbi:DNA ligase (lig) [Plesiocystis pacifica SIR-1]|uniref:DNA ligase (Lig) n=1 Tax=Plesiocystis pacifica SIR-1 TaxID=391625 RepID=A6G570_9BACT|nr:DNA ligase (lig) [Plesiocystis pacifica]EDM78982.1 DNA ligase (lig) [Plesiocystis pacifica SIR-1]